MLEIPAEAEPFSTAPLIPLGQEKSSPEHRAPSAEHRAPSAEKNPETFSHRSLKKIKTHFSQIECSFGEGGRQWAGDIYTAILLIYRPRASFSRRAPREHRERRAPSEALRRAPSEALRRAPNAEPFSFAPRIPRGKKIIMKRWGAGTVSR